ncbi:MAG: ATP-binding protein [Rubrivivax sp.]|nr:ATP-binding protein [Rubrivivax sp.]
MATEAMLEPAWAPDTQSAGDGGRAPRGAPGGGDTAFARILRTYVAARAAVGFGLVAAQVAGSLLGSAPPVEVLAVCIGYAAQAIVWWLLPGLGVAAGARPRRRWWSTIGIDLIAFSTLHWLALGSSFTYAALLVLPVLMAGVLSARLVALGTAAGVTLMLLAGAARLSLGGLDLTVPMLQAGLAGLGFFAITLLAGELAARLAREEAAARGSLALARQQAQLNRLVIEEMADGVLVVDPQLRVRAANPAARTLLVAQGLAPAAPFVLSDRAAWKSLADAAARALDERRWPESGRDVVLPFDGGHTRTVRLRVRFLRTRSLDDERSDGEPFVVLLLEDVRTALARVRQEKLAAMGRISAGIAHEIRNPLAAISQANALMLEDTLDPVQQRLARIVADNVARLRRLVDDVLEVAPGAGPEPPCIDAQAIAAAAVADWIGVAGATAAAAARLRTEWPGHPVPVRFDPEHLRRVLVNLLDNAWRHAADAPGSVFVRLAARDRQTAVLSVLSDSPPIAPEVERHLFEPFFSTRSRGSGLGLYICRELCERYGGSIEYRPRPGAERLRNEFVVTMRLDSAAAE